MNYYEHHLGDYVRDTAHLSMLEDGAYRRLIDAYYIRRGPLPPAARDVYRLVRASSKQDRTAVDVVLREFFTRSEEGWSHGRCDREIARYLDKQEKARRSADARWNPTERNASAMRTHVNDDANAMRAQCGGNALQTPDSSHQSKTQEHPSGAETRARKRGALPARVCPADFEVTAELRIWAAEHCPGIDVDRETEIFRDYTFATAKSDWVKTWRNWMRKAKPISSSTRLTKYEQNRIGLYDEPSVPVAENFLLTRTGT